MELLQFAGSAQGFSYQDRFKRILTDLFRMTPHFSSILLSLGTEVVGEHSIRERVIVMLPLLVSEFLVLGEGGLVQL